MQSQQFTRLAEIVPATEVPRIPKPARIVDADLCPVCKGAGWLRRDVPVGDPDFGKPVKCQCKYVQEAKTAMRKTYTWLGASEQLASELESMTFATFKPNANGKSVAQAYKQARAYADLLKTDSPRSAVLIGPYGIGKTHLACAIMNEVRSAGVASLFVSGNELFQAIYDHDFDESILKRAIETPLLCMDDLDKMQIKDDGSYQKSTLFTLFNQRYLAHRPVIITANEEDDWQRWLHKAVLSRLFGSAEFIAMNGSDYRMAQHG